MKTLIYALILAILVITGCTSKEEAATSGSTETSTTKTTVVTPNPEPVQSETDNTTEAAVAEPTTASDQPSFTQGLARTINPGLLQ